MVAAAPEEDAAEDHRPGVDAAAPTAVATADAAGAAPGVHVVAGLGERLLAQLLGAGEQPHRGGRVLLGSLLGLVEDPEGLGDARARAAADGAAAGADRLVDAAQAGPDAGDALGEVLAHAARVLLGVPHRLEQGVEVVLGGVELGEGAERVAGGARVLRLLHGRPCPVRGLGDDRLARRQALHVTQVGGDRGDAPRELLVGAGQLGVGAGYLVEEGGGLADGLLGRPSGSDGRRAVVALQRLPARRDEAVGRAQQVLGLGAVLAHRHQRLGGVAGGQTGELLVRDGQPLPDLGEATGQLLEELRCPVLQRPQRRELLGVLVERAARRAGELDDAGQHRALDVLRLLLVVVQLLAQRERLGRGLPRLLEDLAELVRALGAELRLGEGQLLLGRAHGVVHADEGLGGLSLQVGQRDALGGRRDRRPAARAAATLAQRRDQARPGEDDDRCREHEHAETAAEAAGGPGVDRPLVVVDDHATAARTAVLALEALDGGRHGTGPVGLPQRRLDVLQLHGAHGLGRQGATDVADAVHAVLDRHGEHEVAVAHPRGLGGLLGPRRSVERLARGVLEGVDEDDEELQARLVAQLLELGARVVLLGRGERVGLVLHRLGEVERLGRVGRHGAGTEGQSGTQPAGHEQAATPRAAAAVLCERGHHVCDPP